MENSDTQTIQRLKHDDVSAFDRLYGKYYQKIYMNVLKQIKNADTSKDIVQEVFITLWEKRQTVDPFRPISNWLFVISYNKSIDYLKRSLNTGIVYDGNIYDIPHWDEINMKEMQLALIEEAVNQLSPQKRKVFKLCKMQGETYEKAANQLQISKYTVKEYLSSAMKNIKGYVSISA